MSDVIVGDWIWDGTELREIVRDPGQRRGRFRGAPDGRKPAALGRPPRPLWSGPPTHSWHKADAKPSGRCQTPGCRRESRRGRALCNTCRQLAQFYGSATVKAHFRFRKWCAVPTTRAYQLIKHVLKTLPRSHPARNAIDHAVQLLQLRIDNASRYAGSYWRAWAPAEEQIRRRLGQYQRHGVTAEQLLAHVAGWIWAQNTFPVLADNDAYFRFQMGRYLLGFIAIPHAERAAAFERVGSVAARTFATQLIDTVGTVAAYLAEPAEFARLYGVELPPKAVKAPSEYAITNAMRRPRYQPLTYDD